MAQVRSPTIGADEGGCRKGLGQAYLERETSKRLKATGDVWQRLY